MDAIDIIKRRLKEDRVPEVPDEITEKRKRPKEVAFMDVNLCFPCGKCPEFCPVQCIEYLADGSLPGRGVQPVQDRFNECIGCYICVEVCALLTDYDAVRMYDVNLVEQVLGTTITDKKPETTDKQPDKQPGMQPGAPAKKPDHTGSIDAGSAVAAAPAADALTEDDMAIEWQMPRPQPLHPGFACR